MLKELVGQMSGDANVAATYLLSFMALTSRSQSVDAMPGNIWFGRGGHRVRERMLAKGSGKSLACSKPLPGPRLPWNFALGPVSARRANEAGLVARGYRSSLVQFDPANRTWRFEYAKSFLSEGGVFASRRTAGRSPTRLRAA